MNRQSELDWRDLEIANPVASPADSGVWAYPNHEPFPLVHRLAPPAADLHRLAFFATERQSRDFFDDLVDERAEAIWHERRYRRAAVKTLAAFAFAALAAVAVLAARESPHARSAVTEWATLGAAR